MDNRTLKALKGSIRKWEAIVAGVGYDRGTANCPLCRLFYDQEGVIPTDDGPVEVGSCAGCPVAEHVGANLCDDTPYYEVGLGLDELATEPEQIARAQAELDFLKSLLPKESYTSRPIVIIESPFAGDRTANGSYLNACLRDSWLRGELPFASHGFFPRFLNEDDEAERRAGIEAGYRFWAFAEAIIFYVDHGMSEGMSLAYTLATKEDRIIKKRTLAQESGAP